MQRKVHSWNKVLRKSMCIVWMSSIPFAKVAKKQFFVEENIPSLATVKGSEFIDTTVSKDLVSAFAIDNSLIQVTLIRLMIRARSLGKKRFK